MAEDELVTLDELALRLIHGGDRTQRLLKRENARYELQSKQTPSGVDAVGEGPMCSDVFHPPPDAEGHPVAPHCTPDCWGLLFEHNKNVEAIANRTSPRRRHHRRR
jgi:hypothetical protein